MTASALTRTGMLERIRSHLFGDRDRVEEQLADIARQGSGMARLAHGCAFLLILLFSSGSIVALSGDSLAQILAEWRVGGVNIPAAISGGVSTLLVLCMDTGMIYAAAMLRTLNARRAAPEEKRLYMWVVGVVAILEAATYAYMSAEYEHSTQVMVWALILARAGAAPLLSVYLSMARPLPVGARDILYQVELATSRGVIRDAVTVANDEDALLARKMALYAASAVMTDQDAGRISDMIRVMETQPGRTGLIGAASDEPETPSRPPTGPGQSYHNQGHVMTRAGRCRGHIAASCDATVRSAARVARRRLACSPRRYERVASKYPRKGCNLRTQRIEAKARAEGVSGMPVSELPIAAGISRSMAGKYRRILMAEAENTGQVAQ